jgi:DNA processing protein
VPLDDRQRLACLRLIRSENIGPVTFRELINLYGGARQALDALPDIARRGRRSLAICPADRAEAELDAAHRAGAVPLFTIEPGYPPLLAHVESPPPLLYVKGRAALLEAEAIALVGSRDASAAGITLSRQFAARLGEAGFVVVSGPARGIDAAAHQAALATGTVAVLAGGVDRIYPPENAALHERIAAEGCLVAEMPPGFVPRAQDFPRRNRIISGVSRAVVVIEAARRSGTLITARTAGEQGRDVFAVPGHPLDPRAEGTNQLLKNGATIALSAEDVIEVLGPQMRRFEAPRATYAVEAPAPTASRPSLPPQVHEGDVGKVAAALGPAPVGVDEIVRATGLESRIVQVALLELTVAGRIERHGNGLVSIRTAGGD